MGPAVAVTELGLDLSPPAAAIRAVNGFLRVAAAAVVAGGDDGGEKVKLEEYVRSLEEERRKIEAFKRELPLSIVVLNHVIEGLKEEAEQCRVGMEAKARPVLEEFMPINSKFDDEGGVKTEKDYRDKMNWMSSAQLWSDNNYSNDHINTTTDNTNTNTNIREKRSDNLFAEAKYRSGGGAFVPFKCQSSFPARKEEKEKEVPPPASATSVSLTDFSLLSPGVKSSRAISVMKDDEHGPVGVGSKNSSTQQPSQQTSRKARRCWSPELHRRFVGALQQLGGSQVATPKQIRELMKVDGLTNDEVKSHLQKYRLHTRRMPASITPANQSVVVLEGLWVPEDDYPASKQSTSQSGSPQGPLQLASAARGGDSCEDDDGRSESYSWKGNLQRSSGEDTD